MVDESATGVGLTRRRVLIADDNPHVRRELRTLLELAGPIEIVGEAADGRETVRLTEALRPEVVLMDLEMPVLDGYEAARQIKAGAPSCRVVALTVHGYGAARQKAAQSGVDAFLVKGTDVESLVGTILGAGPVLQGLGNP
jgi:DNA-binding NarL/FixJ family response regulator